MKIDVRKVHEERLEIVNSQIIKKAVELNKLNNEKKKLLKILNPSKKEWFYE